MSWASDRKRYTAWLLHDFDWLFWVDCDLYFMNPSKTVDALIQSALSRTSEASLLIAEDGMMLNSGAFLLRNNAWGADFLTRTVDLLSAPMPQSFQHMPWHEQAPLMYLTLLPTVLQGLSGESLTATLASGSALSSGYDRHVVMMRQKAMNSYPQEVVTKTQHALPHDGFEEGDLVISFNGCSSILGREFCEDMYDRYHAERACLDYMSVSGALCDGVRTSVVDPDRSVLVAEGEAATALLRRFVDSGLDVNAADATLGQTPLAAAVRLGLPLEGLEVLLKAGARPSGVDDQEGGSSGSSHRCTPDIVIFQQLQDRVATTVAPNCREVVKLMVKWGLDVNILSPSTGESLLLASLKAGEAGLAEDLLTAGAQATATDAAGNSPLHVAAAIGAYPVAEMLLKQGADVRAKNADGHSPVMCARLGSVAPGLRLSADWGWAAKETLECKEWNEKENMMLEKGEEVQSLFK
ncbi:unnamed protein product [Polarella glacialis]|uniref:Uncharacterized protein n=1 Tax=Polarella glacialis TaxID=89957 RepID=A0A813GV19_POLGL|nr:unnamed protein product [Polarella glacialis]